MNKEQTETLTRRPLQRLVGIRQVQRGDRILRGDGAFSEVLGIYPAAGTHFVQFKDGQGWHCPDNGRVFIANAKLSRSRRRLSSNEAREQRISQRLRKQKARRLSALA